MADELIGNCRTLFVDHKVVKGGLRAIELAHHHGIPVVGDVEGEVDPDILELMSGIDHLIVGTELARRVSGADHPAEMARILGGGRLCAVVTAGEQGCWYSLGGAPAKHFPAFRVQAVDTTGCGDVFHGAYATCIAQGQAVEEAIRVASAAAAIKATRSGGRAGIPTRAAIDRFLDSLSEKPVA
jgi:sulfofructose kinase